MVARHFDCNGDDAHWEAEVVPAKSGGFIVSASTIVTSIVCFFYRQNTFSSFLFQFLEKIPAQLYTNDLQISEIYLFHPQEFKIWQTYLLVVMLIVMLVAMVEMLVMMWLATLVLMLVISAGGGVGGHDKCWNIKQRMRESIKNNIQMLNPFYIHEKCWYPRIPIVVKTETQRKFRHKYKWTSWFSAAAWPSR